MSKKKTRVTTNQPGVYLNQQTENYDIKYNYTEYDPISNQKKHRSKWIYGIHSYRDAVKSLANMKIGKASECFEDITLEKSLELWMNKATANNYSQASIRNTKQQYNMITKFWTPEAKLKCITEDNYLELISKCRAYGYSEETVYNINACLRKLVKLAYRNRKLTEKLFDEFENMALWKPLIQRGRVKMASRDMALRDAFHYQLAEYIQPLDKEEYQKFLGATGDELERLMQENSEFHRFEDGNKRLAITLSAYFLLLNGHMAVAKDFFIITENSFYPGVSQQ